MQEETKRIIASLAIIAVTICVVWYGFTKLADSEAICWQKYADEPCMTTWELLIQPL